MTAPDRKRLWGHGANRCALCRTWLTRPATALDVDAEAIVGEEAHIVGENPGSARYRAMDRRARDGYENRILLCPNDHTAVDAQPGHWTEELLRNRKAQHERLMELRTDDGRRNAGFEFEAPPGLLELPPVISGKTLLDIVGSALAYQFDHDAFQSEGESAAGADLLQQAQDWGEIYADIGPAGRIDAAKDLSAHIVAALQAGLILYGANVPMTVRFADANEPWPVAVLVLRRAEDAARDQ